MRTDAKIGFAIGGVLLAVLTVYAIVIPRHRHPAVRNGVSLISPTGTAPTPSPAPPISITPPSPNAIASSQTNTTTSDQSVAALKPVEPSRPTAVATATTPRSADGVDWAKLLSGSQNAPPLFTTTTPPPSDGSNGDVMTMPDDAKKTATPETATVAGTSTLTSSGTTAEVPPSITLEKSHKNSAAAATSTGGRTYTIKSGQTLSSIASDIYGNQRFYVAIMRANPTVNANRLRVGTKIILPNISDVQPETSSSASADDSDTTPVKSSKSHHARSSEATSSRNTGQVYTVQSGDTLYRISKKLYHTSRRADSIYDMNEDLIGDDKSRLKVGMVLKLPIPPTVAVASDN